MLDDNSKFGVKALTEAINRLDATPTPIRDLALFETRSLSTTYVDIENQDGQLKLVQSQQRGTSGEALPEKTRSIRSFKIPHLPINDVIFADDVQNIRAFGSTQAETVMQKVNEKLAEGKLALEMTREHLQLGALNGKILDADGSELYDIYKEFGLTRKKHVWALDNAQTEVGALIDKTLMAQRKLLKGAMPMGWLALCGMTFLEKLKYHPTIKPLYERYRDGALYREGGINQVEFEHNGIKFVAYTTDFGTRHAKIEENQAILLPTGKNLYREFFAPADMNATVNTVALPYYASREKKAHDKGWDVHMQSNPLPLVLRPELVCTLSLS